MSQRVCMPHQLYLNLGVLSLHPEWGDMRVKRTLTFFGTKGFLPDLRYPWVYQHRLTLADVLWVCDNVIPDLYEVLPAAMLRFPNHLAGAWPEDLAATCAAMAKGMSYGPDYKIYEYERVRHWTNVPSADRRVTPRLTISRHYKLPAGLAGRLRARSHERGTTQTRVVIEALEAVLGLGPEDRWEQERSCPHPWRPFTMRRG